LKSLLVAVLSALDWILDAASGVMFFVAILFLLLYLVSFKA
jgi:hypothetical protein